MEPYIDKIILSFSGSIEENKVSTFWIFGSRIVRKLIVIVRYHSVWFGSPSDRLNTLKNLLESPMYRNKLKEQAGCEIEFAYLPEEPEPQFRSMYK